MSAQVITIANRKGGCGKTTTAVNLSAGLALAGYKTCLVDVDGQCNATDALGVNRAELEASGRYSTADALLHAVPAAEIVVPLPGRFKEKLWVAPSHPGLNSLPLLIGQMYFELVRKKKLSCSPDEFERAHIGRLRESLSALKDFDYLIIDTPPALGFHIASALVASDWVLIPVFADKDSLEALEALTNFSNDIIQTSNPALELVGVLLGNADSRTRINRQIHDTLEATFGSEKVLFKTQISKSVRVAEARAFTQTIFEYEPTNKVASEFKALVKELTKRVEQMRVFMQKEVVNRGY